MLGERKTADWLHGCGCLSLKLCQLMNPDDILSGEGPGPRNL